MRTTKILMIVVLTEFIFSCAPSRFVKPLKEKEQAAGFSFGGPVIKFSGAPIPMPFTTLSYGYGLRNNLTCFGSLHTTSLLFGNFQTDVGTTFNLWHREEKAGISMTPALQLAYNLRNMTGLRVWPTVDVNAWFNPNDKPSFLYAGINCWLELAQIRAHGEPQPRHAIPNLHLGYMIVKTKWNHQFQMGYLGIGIPNLPGVVEYIGISQKGALSFHYSICRKF